MDKKRGLMLVLCTAIISGISIFLNSYAVKGFDSSVFTFAKNIVVAVLLFSIILFVGNFRDIKALKSKQWLQLSLIGLIGGGIPFILFFKGLQMTTGTTSGFLQKSMFIFVALMSLAFLKERLDRKTIISASMLLIGTFMIARPDLIFSSGHIYVLIAVLFWAAENLISKNALATMSGNTVAWGRMFIGSMVILAYLLITGTASKIFTMSMNQYAWIAITSALLLGYVMTYYNGLKHISPTIATAMLTVGAPITYILTVISGGRLGIADIAGASLIIVGVAVLLWYSHIAGYLNRLLSVNRTND